LLYNMIERRIFDVSLLFIYSFICSTGDWTQGLHLQLFHKSFFCEGFFWDRVTQTIFLGWLWTLILLISASWIARITGMLGVSLLIEAPIWSWSLHSYDLI
jgi:hypothetical protein